ncbi:MAG TPA: hypothetical protein VNC13_03490 [Propionibacteriaceae bacterium]|jgi:hypothetical protein|nr:hypothetical protein [Propionibacteriaceae bacterium]
MKSNRSLNPYQALDRAAMVLGLVSIISAAFLFVHGTFQLVQIGAVGLVVAIVLGLLAIAAGLLAERTLMIAGGVGFLLAGAAQLALLAGGSSGFLGGNASTFSLWLGLGAGLIAIGSVPRPEMAEEMPATE